jgi:hypothetical protein
VATRRREEQACFNYCHDLMDKVHAESLKQWARTDDGRHGLPRSGGDKRRGWGDVAGRACLVLRRSTGWPSAWADVGGLVASGPNKCGGLHCSTRPHYGGGMSPISVSKLISKFSLFLQLSNQFKLAKYEKGSSIDKKIPIFAMCKINSKGTTLHLGISSIFQ